MLSVLLKVLKFMEEEVSMRFLKWCLPLFLFGFCPDPGEEKSASPSNKSNHTAAMSDLLSGFSWNLFKALENDPDFQDKSLLVSPASISAAFALTYAGAKGDTAQHLAKIIGYPTTPALFGEVYREWVGVLKGQKDQDGFELALANQVWGQEGFGWLEEFKANLSNNFGAKFLTKDFTNSANHPVIAGEVNDFASENTNGKINQVITADDLETDTVTLLANALYFQGDWTHPFQNPGEDFDRTGAFTKPDGSTSDVTYMDFGEAVRGIPYFENDSLQAIELAYQSSNPDKQIVMDILLPREGLGLADMIKSFDKKAFAKVLKGLEESDKEPHKTMVRIPKWTFRPETVKLANVLKSMGLNLPFEEYNPVTGSGADFSRMNGKRNIFLDQVFHKTFIKVDETGTEAAAVTVIGGMRATSVELPVATYSFVAKRPFIYVIRDKISGSILFIGKMLDPSQES